MENLLFGLLIIICFINLLVSMAVGSFLYRLANRMKQPLATVAPYSKPRRIVTSIDEDGTV